MPTIEDLQQEIIADFELLEQWEDKYNYIIDLGKTLEPIQPQYKTDQYRIKGCQAQVWLWAELQADGKLHFSADSDAIITKGLIAMLINLLNQQTPKDVHHAQLFFIETIGLHQHLSPSRSNGFAGMVQQMKQYAHVFLQKQLAGNVVGE